MQYVLLIYTPELGDDVPPEALAAEMEGYNAFTAHLRERGTLLAGEALDGVAPATTVRVVDGRTITTDGPFAETKETLGGFYLVEAAGLDEAIGYAAMLPGARIRGGHPPPRDDPRRPHRLDRGPAGLGVRHRGRQRAGSGDGRELTVSD